jgi:hypothetical protein
MHAQTRAFVVHRTPTRIRIKIPDRQRQQAYFAALERVLIQHPNILRVESNPLTASVIIESREAFELTPQQRQFLGLEICEAKDIGRDIGQPGYVVRAGNGTGALSENGFTFAVLILKLIVAISTRQFGVQLLEWFIDACVQISRQEARRRAALRQPFLVAPVK